MLDRYRAGHEDFSSAVFGLRRPRITFKDLDALEEDMMEPAIRLVFTGLIAITIAFIFAIGMVNVNVGGLNSAHLLTNGS